MNDCACLSTVGRQTPCECELPGWCVRHKCEKNSHFHGLCANDIRYFKLYEEGRGPCIGVDRSKELGEITSRTSRTSIGLGDIVEWLAKLIRIKPWPGCGCAKRKAWLNRIIVWGWWRRAS